MARRVKSRGRTSAPKQGCQVNWANPITRGLAFLYAPGLTFDFASRRGATFQSGGSATVLARRSGSALVMDGTDQTAFEGIVLSTTPLLGLLNNSSVVAVASTRSVMAYSGQGNPGESGGGGNAIYCERAASGNDIYKLAMVADVSLPSAEFTYRNDAGVLLQQRALDSTLNDGRPHFYAMTKNGTAHMVRSNNISATGTFGSSSTAFTDAGLIRFVGNDKADVNSAWNGYIYMVAGWTRTLDIRELDRLQVNPWQLWAEPQPWFIASVSLQTIYPASDISAGNWTPSTGVSLYATIDETTASDVDYDTTPNASSMTVKLQPASNPGVTTGHVVRYRCQGAGVLTVDLLQGATIIATWVHSPAPAAYTTFAQTLTGTQAGTITDYTDLRLRFTAS